MRDNASILPETSASVYEVPAFNDIQYPAYRAELRELRVQLLLMQEWAAREGKRIAIALEGRDAAGKGGAATGIARYLNPKTARIISQGIPSQREMRNWLGYHYKLMPSEGNIAIFDRSWYSRALIQPAMGYCSVRQYHYFMNKVNEWEKGLMDEGVSVLKIYLSVSRGAQELRFKLRRRSELQYWKYSANDRKVSERWNLLTYFKERMFAVTSTDYAPWVIVNSDNKHQARLNAIHYILSQFDYDGSDIEVDLEYLEQVNSKKIDMVVDGVLFTGLNADQVAILERIHMHE